jgi:hypothetical protein
MAEHHLDRFQGNAIF